MSFSCEIHGLIEDSDSIESLYLIDSWLGVRAWNGLYYGCSRNDVPPQFCLRRISHVERLTDRELLVIKNLGKVSVAEIRNAIRDYRAQTRGPQIAPEEWVGAT